MSGALVMIDEIKRKHYTNLKSKDKTVKKRGRPKKTEAKPEESVSVDKKQNEPSDVTSFSMQIIGGIGLPGYPLEKGESLAIVKLTPIRP